MTKPLSHFSLLIILFYTATSLPLYSSDYLLLPHNNLLFIPLSNSLLQKSNNGTMDLLKINTKIQVRSANGTYIDSPYETGNILVKYWKNSLNTPAYQVLAYPYEIISNSKKILTATDPYDQGLFDIQALHNYENEHNFIHSYGNQISDVLFVLAIYRNSLTNLTDLLGMSKISNQIKISLSIIKANPSDLKCSFCSIKTFCPTKQCECYQEIYSDCRIKRKSIIVKTDSNTTLTDSISLQVGTLSFMQIEPDNATLETYKAKVLFRFNCSDPLKTSNLRSDRIFSLTYVQNSTDPSFMIPNIYNYNSINSPSLNVRITSLSVNTPQVSAYVGAVSADGQIYVYEESNLKKGEILTMAIYYLNDTAPSAVIFATTNPNANADLNVHMEMSLDSHVQEIIQGSMSIGLIVGLIALSFFLLLVLICVLHVIVTKRFSIFSIFSNSESSNRTSMLSARLRSRKISNMSQQASSLPEITYDFMKQLVFRPLKFIYSPNLQRKTLKKTTQKSSGGVDELCSICLQEFNSQSMVKYTYCGHILDSKCIGEWFKKQESCPLCRQKLQSDDISEYESRIMQEVWQNEYYQNVLDEEVNILKRVYKEWEDKKATIEKEGNQCLKYTEESLVENNFSSSKYIENAIHNISTMQELERSLQPVLGTKLQESSLFETPKKKETMKEFVMDNLVSNLSQINQPLPETIKLQSLPWLIPVLESNNSLSFKRFIKIYRFYRCIYLYHQINKKFEKDSNLYEPSICVEEKDKHTDVNTMELKPITGMPLQQIESGIFTHDSLYLTSRKCMIREHQEDQRNRYYFDEGHQAEIQTSFNPSENPMISSLSLKKIKNSKHGRVGFHLDFQFNESELPQSQKRAEQNSSIVPHPTLIMEENEEPVLLREPTNSSQQSQALKHAQKGKCVTIREEMDGLQRQFAQNAQRKPSQQMNEDMRFREHESVLEREYEDEQNERYVVDQRYAQVLSPIVVSPMRKMSVKRQSTNRSHMRKQLTDRQNLTQSIEVSRGIGQSKFSEEKKSSSLSNDSGKSEQSGQNKSEYSGQENKKEEQGSSKIYENKNS